MKAMLIIATATSFVFGMAFGREVVSTPTNPTRQTTIIVEPRVAQLNDTESESKAQCTTKYVTTTSGNGKMSTRKSVDCDE